MAGTLRFDWNASGGSDRFRQAAERALEGLRPDAQTIWDGVVPVKTGALKRSWYSIVNTTGGTVMLIFGATVFYAIFVELGTIHMAPRYPLRRTAQAVAPMVLPRFLQELKVA